MSAKAVPKNSSGAPPAKVQEFLIRVPNLPRKHHMMRFNATLNVDFGQWRDVKMERENNMRQFQNSVTEDMPKFGAGSEYNRDQREEHRRKKFGFNAKKYRPEAQPYILKPNGKGGKKFKGIREGGVSENAAYYVFTQMAGGGIEAHPLEEWYNFQPIQRYNTLSAEEAEHEFGRRKKVLNYFSLMMRKRLKGDEEEEQDPDEVKIKKVGAAAASAKQLKISEMDEWIDSDDDSDSDEDEDDKKKKVKKGAEDDSSDEDRKAGKKSKGKGKGGAAAKKKQKRDVDDDDEAFEESDDGDQEGRELEYDTESSEDEPDPESKLSKDMKSVAEEDALRNLLTSGDEDDDENKKSDESDKDDEKEKNAKNDKENNKNKRKMKSRTKKQAKNENKDSSDELSSNSSDSEDEEISSNSKKAKQGANNSKIAAKNARSAKSNAVANAVANKSKMNERSGSDRNNNNNNAVSSPTKYARLELKAPLQPSTSGSVISANIKDDCGISEESLRRYLMRKPMTTTELLTKFRNKKSGIASERLIETMTALLKKINPSKQTIKGKMYLSLNK